MSGMIKCNNDDCPINHLCLRYTTEDVNNRFECSEEGDCKHLIPKKNDRQENTR